MEQYPEDPWRGRGLRAAERFRLADAPRLSRHCPAQAPTPLRTASARRGTGRLGRKEARARMRPGRLKAPGAAHARARAAATGAPDRRRTLRGWGHGAAGAGHRGTAGARRFGAPAHRSQTRPEPFAARLRDSGAAVRRAGGADAASLRAAAEAHGWTLPSVSSGPRCTDAALRGRQGRLRRVAEVAAQIHPPHVPRQAGVGGLAASTAPARHVRGDGPQIIPAAPGAARARIEGIRAGQRAETTGPASCRGRLDCKTGPSRDADACAIIGAAQALRAAGLPAAQGLPAAPSGPAGVAGPHLPPEARGMATLGAGPQDG